MRRPWPALGLSAIGNPWYITTPAGCLSSKTLRIPLCPQALNSVRYVAVLKDI